jgi:uncharacterized protein (DUF58 family)
MKPTFRLDFPRLLLALSMLFVLFLASAYLGGSLRSLHLFFAMFLIINFVHFAWSIRNIYHYQSFSTSSPVRGQAIDYHLTLHNLSLVPGCRTRFALADLEFFTPESKAEKDLDFFLGSDCFFKREYQLQCHFRGVYALGLSSIELTDILALVVASLPVVPETLHVLPRMLELKTCRLSSDNDAGLTDQAAEGVVEDYTRFRELEEYHPGASIKHLDWKRFAAWGRPVLRHFDSSADPGLCIYLDRRHSGPSCPRQLEADDCSIEIALALGLFFLRHHVPVHIRLEDGFTLLEDGSSDPEDGNSAFHQFLLSTVHIRFSGHSESSVNLVEEFEEDRRSGTLPASSILGIFRTFDRYTLAFLEDCGNQQEKTIAVVITSLLDEAERQQLEAYTARHNLDGRIFLVHSSASIKDDLS